MSAPDLLKAVAEAATNSRVRASRSAATGPLWVPIVVLVTGGVACLFAEDVPACGHPLPSGLSPARS